MKNKLLQDADRLRERLAEAGEAHRSNDEVRFCSLVASLMRDYPLCTPAMVYVALANQKKDVLPRDEDSRTWLEAAVRLDPSSLEALEELAHYVGLWEGSEQALPIFARLKAKALEGLRRAIGAQLECLDYLERKDELKQVLGQAKVFFPDHPDTENWSRIYGAEDR